MNITPDIILYILALVFFALASFTISIHPRINNVAVGLFFLTLAISPIV